MLSHHFVRWLIIHGTRKSKISGGGGSFVRFSYFMHVTCHFALFNTFMPCLRQVQTVCEWLQMFLRWFQVIVEIFEVVVDGCRQFQVVLGCSMFQYLPKKAMKQLCSYYFKFNSQGKKVSSEHKKLQVDFLVMFITEFNPKILKGFVKERKVSFLLVTYPVRKVCTNYTLKTVKN